VDVKFNKFKRLLEQETVLPTVFILAWSIGVTRQSPLPGKSSAIIRPMWPTPATIRIELQQFPQARR